MNLALVRLNEGDAADALAHAERARAILRDVGLRWSESAALANGGLARLALGRLDEAAADFRAASELADRHRLANLALPPLSGLAAVALARGDVAGALDQVRAIQARLNDGASLDGWTSRCACAGPAIGCRRRRADPEADAADAGPRRAQAHGRSLDRSRHRQRLLREVPVHRAIVEACDALGSRA
jgi:ATP/maltotriose-dependent transcriptional regulator MalT